jgi:hypothetical protein
VRGSLLSQTNRNFLPLADRASAFYAEQKALPFEKYAIPNPFGQYEEPRFTAYLMKPAFAR